MKPGLICDTFIAAFLIAQVKIHYYVFSSMQISL